jgi:hypothetical protein
MGPALDALLQLYKGSAPLENTDHLGRFLTVQDMQKLAALEQKDEQQKIQLSFNKDGGGVTLLPLPDGYLDKMLGRRLLSFFKVQHQDETLRLRQAAIDIFDQCWSLYQATIGNCCRHECLRKIHHHFPLDMPLV